MAFQPVPNCASVEILGDYHGERVENTLYYLYPTTPTEADLQDLVDAIAPVVNGTMMPLLPPQWVGVQVYARGLSLAIDVQATNVTMLGVAGSFPSPGLPGNVTIAVKRSSGLTGRSSRGRIYWMGLPESEVTGNSLSVGLGNQLPTTMEDIDGAALAEGWTPVIVSRRQAGVLLATALTYPITNWSLEDYRTDSQRRRLAGRGS